MGSGGGSETVEIGVVTILVSDRRPTIDILECKQIFEMTSNMPLQKLQRREDGVTSSVQADESELGNSPYRLLSALLKKKNLPVRNPHIAVHRMCSRWQAGFESDWVLVHCRKGLACRW